MKKYRTNETTMKMDEFGLNPVFKSILLAKSILTEYHERRSDHRVKSYGRFIVKISQDVAYLKGSKP